MRVFAFLQRLIPGQADSTVSEGDPKFNCGLLLGGGQMSWLDTKDGCEMKTLKKFLVPQKVKQSYHVAKQSHF